MLQSLDEQQSVQLLQCYLQEDYRGTRDSLKVSELVVLRKTVIYHCIRETNIQRLQKDVITDI